ncbi:Activating signal cointegrator 1 complex subunit 1 [Bienertia sinuspersici]
MEYKVGASVMRFIIGKDRSVQKGIEEEMGVKMLFPSSKKEDSIVIEGESMDAITKASEKIQAIIDEVSHSSPTILCLKITLFGCKDNAILSDVVVQLKRYYEAVNSPSLNYSHFISLPLAIHTELVNKLNRFQSIILGDSDLEDANETMDVDSNDENSEDEETSKIPEKTPEVALKLKVDDTNNVKVDIKNIPLVSYAPATKSPALSDLGIDKSIFIKPKTFHLTVLMLKLWNKRRIHAAKEVLQGVYPELMEVLDNRALFVKLKGLDCLRGSHAKAQVLYAPVEEIGNEGRLVRACPFIEIIIDAYVKAGLVLEKDVRQKLKLHATVMNTTHRKGRKRFGLLKGDGKTPLMREASSSNLDPSNGVIITSVKLIYPKDFCTMKMVTTIAVLPYPSQNSLKFLNPLSLRLIQLKCL